MNTTGIHSQHINTHQSSHSTPQTTTEAKGSTTFDALSASPSRLAGNESIDEHEVFFDAQAHFDSLGSQLAERLTAAFQSVKEAIPHLKMQLASISEQAGTGLKDIAKTIADKMSGASANIAHMQEKAAAHGCKLETPFNQEMFLYSKQIDDPTFGADFARVSNSSGPGVLCLGLSTTWLQHKVQGQDTPSFFDKINDHEKDSSMARALGIQFIEQRKHPDKKVNAENMLNDILPKLGMKLDTVENKQGETISKHFQLEMGHLDQYKERGLIDGKEQNFLLLSPHHAMALHKSADGKMEFFDSLYGVVKADNKDDMFAFIKDAAQDDVSKSWGGRKPVAFQMAEVVSNF